MSAAALTMSATTAVRRATTGRSALAPRPTATFAALRAPTRGRSMPRKIATLRGASTPRTAVCGGRGGRLAVRASSEAEAEAAPAPPAPEMDPVPGSFSKICAVEDLPRGDRKKVDAMGKSMLLFWYKDAVLCIESRSPAEGAFSEGFENARLTQDGCIVCPSTASTFELATGEIKSWYPDNPVLRKLTPVETCRPMEVFPVLVRPDGIYVDIKGGSLGPDFVAPVGKGGSNTSLENNNVYAVEPQMYVEGKDGERVVAGDRDVEMSKMDPGQVAISIAGVAALALGGSATCVFYENYVALGLFWLVGFGIAAKVSLDATGALDDDEN